MPNANPSSERKRRLVVSFTPQPQLTKYPSLNPGLYVFIQHKDTTEVFLARTQTGHGHALIANLVNQESNLPKNDFSWVGLAGETLIGSGGKILGYALRTGYFHEILDLTEPAPDNPIYDAYISRMILGTASFPRAPLLNVNTWENIISHELRNCFFHNGIFRKLSQLEIDQLKAKFLSPTILNDEKAKNLLYGLFKALEEQLIPDSGLSCLAACPSTFFSHTQQAENREEGNFVKFFSHPAPAQRKPPSSPALNRNHEEDSETYQANFKNP